MALHGEDQTVGRYKVLEVLGQGGMGIVYRAMDTGLDRIVAIKTILPHLAENKAFVDRLWKEAKALAKLEHPHIVRIHNVEETLQGLFIIMEYVDGVTLKHQGRLPWHDALPLLKQTLRAFDYAHRHGVIHRDVKPANLMVTREKGVKVMDFGLAKVLQPDHAHTATQGLIGTLFYMSPEQVRGLEHVDHRSDLYSLGMTFVEVLTGTVPFQAKQSEFAVMQAIVQGEGPDLAVLAPDLPAGLVHILAKATAHAPEDRYQTAAEMRAALHRFEAQQVAPTQPIEPPAADTAGLGKTPPRPAPPRPVPPRPADAPRSPRRGRLLAGGLVGVVLAGLGALVMTGVLPGRPPPAAQAFDVSTVPDQAAVFLDGDSLGLTPLTLPEVQAGVAVTLRLRKAGFAPLDTTLVLAASAPALRFGLQPLVRLSLAVTPADATVRLGGQPVTLGAEPLERPAGPTRLQITHDGFAPLDTTLVLTARAETLRVDLAAASGSAPPGPPIPGPGDPALSGTLSVLVQPWGTIYIDGTLRQRDTNVRYTEALATGLHRIRLVHPDYGTWQEDVVLAPGARREVVVDFTRTFSVLVSADSDPKTDGIFWAEIYVDGQNTGAVTPAPVTLRPGLHTIEVRRDGYTTARRSLNVSKDIMRPPLLFILKKE